MKVSKYIIAMLCVAILICVVNIFAKFHAKAQDYEGLPVLAYTINVNDFSNRDVIWEDVIVPYDEYN